jgi:hypothetical protein
MILQQHTIEQSYKGTQEGDSGSKIDMGDVTSSGSSMSGNSFQQAQQSKDGDHHVRPESEMGGPSAPEGKQARKARKRGCPVTTSDYCEGDLLGRDKPRTVIGIRVEGRIEGAQMAGWVDEDDVTQIEVSMIDSQGKKKKVILDVAPDLSGSSGSSGSAFTDFESSTK